MALLENRKWWISLIFLPFPKSTFDNARFNDTVPKKRIFFPFPMVIFENRTIQQSGGVFLYVLALTTVFFWCLFGGNNVSSNLISRSFEAIST